MITLENICYCAVIATFLLLLPKMIGQLRMPSWLRAKSYRNRDYLLEMHNELQQQVWDLISEHTTTKRKIRKILRNHKKRT